MKPIKPYSGAYEDYQMHFTGESEIDMDPADSMLDNAPVTDKQVDADFFNGEATFHRTGSFVIRTSHVPYTQ
eukprot:8624575-Pyramimonas_sp.AAC.1